MYNNLSNGIRFNRTEVLHFIFLVLKETFSYPVILNLNHLFVVNFNEFDIKDI